MDGEIFSQIDFGPVQKYLDDDDVTDISYSNGGQVWLKTLSKGIYRVEDPEVNDTFMAKCAFQCANAMGKSFNMASPFLDAESTELRLNFVHESIARNGIACVFRKTPAKIRLEKEKLIKDDYVALDIHDLLMKCVEGHCNIIVCGETGSGKTEFVKYLAAHTKEDEKLITIEDTLELHLDRIFPHRDIVAMKTNNIASYSDVLVTCMRQNPKWILLSEIRSAEAVLAARNSISSGHYILSTIHADKAASIPERMYSLLETNQDIGQFLKTIYRYIQIGVYIRGYTDKQTHSFKREIAEVTEFFVTEDNEAKFNTIYKKTSTGKIIKKKPSKYLYEYLEVQGVVLDPNMIQEEGIEEEEKEDPFADTTFNPDILPKIDTSDQIRNTNTNQVNNVQNVSSNVNPVNSAPNINNQNINMNRPMNNIAQNPNVSTLPNPNNNVILNTTPSTVPNNNVIPNTIPGPIPNVVPRTIPNQVNPTPMPNYNNQVNVANVNAFNPNGVVNRPNVIQSVETNN